MPQFQRTEDTTSLFCSYGQALQRLSILDDIDIVSYNGTYDCSDRSRAKLPKNDLNIVYAETERRAH